MKEQPTPKPEMTREKKITPNPASETDEDYAKTILSSEMFIPLLYNCSLLPRNCEQLLDLIREKDSRLFNVVVCSSSHLVHCWKPQCLDRRYCWGQQVAPGACASSDQPGKREYATWRGCDSSYGGWRESDWNSIDRLSFWLFSWCNLGFLRRKLRSPIWVVTRMWS